MAAILNSDYWKKQVLRHVDILDNLTGNRFSDANTADEAFLYIMKGLEKDDWHRVRNFEGKARFATYLYSVAGRLLEDFSRHKFGRLRPPAWIKAKGPVWNEVFRRLCREQMSVTDVKQSLSDFTGDRNPSIIEEAIEVILSKVTDCGKYTADPVSTESKDIDEYASPRNLSPDELLERHEHISTLHAVFTSITGKNTDFDSPNTRIGTLIQQFQSHLKLETRERLFLKTIYQGGQTVDEAGRILGWNSNQAHGKLHRLKVRIQKAMKKTELEQNLKILLTIDD
ncbi:MAG: hypothetical protein GY795_35715 [Desulfobacterales bacterium]|nr:hypothetical protein [Desulfobacterales bacterium]